MPIIDDIIIDNFAGGGGASTGIEEALDGRPVDHAINHDPKALGMHRINHARTVHHCEDVFDIDPVRVAGGRSVGFGWFSPDCKHFSKAKGGKPLDKKIRGLVLVMLRWAAIRTRVMIMENVEEIQTYGPLLPNGKPDPRHLGRTWNAFLQALGPGLDPNHPDLPEMLRLLRGTLTREQLMRGFGYQVETRELRACDYGAPTIRKRLFLIARCDGLPIVWPKPTHAAPADAAALGLLPWRPIADCLDWSLPCPSIFLTARQARKANCKRPLARATLRRIASGLDRYVLRSAQPFVFSLTHHGGDRTESLTEPAKTITAAHRGETALVNVTLSPFIGDANRPFKAQTSAANAPMNTLCAGVKGGHFQLVTANLVKLRGDPATHAPGHHPAEPGHTVSAGGTHHAVAVAYLAQHNGGFNTTPGHPASAPLSTVSSKGAQQQLVSAFLTPYHHGNTTGFAVDRPARSATTKARFNLAEATLNPQPLSPQQRAGALRVARFLRRHGVAVPGEFATLTLQGVDWVIVDIGMRMLTARELFRAQGFPDSYVIDKAWLIHPHTGALREVTLTKEEQIRMCGNSVCPPLSRALTAANVPRSVYAA